MTTTLEPTLPIVLYPTLKLIGYLLQHLYCWYIRECAQVQVSLSCYGATCQDSTSCVRMPNKIITFISSTTFKCMKNELGMKKCHPTAIHMKQLRPLPIMRKWRISILLLVEQHDACLWPMTFIIAHVILSPQTFTRIFDCFIID